MSNTVPAQHPAVVLRSSYLQLRALLAIAVIAIVGLAIAVAVMAIDTTTSKSVSPAARIVSPAIPTSVAPAVTPNPDELGAQPPVSHSRPARVVDYPGHF